MFKIFSIGLGGFVGALSRYAVGGLVHRLLKNPWFPFGTITVNILGCLVIGFLSGLVENRQMFSPEVRLFIFIGFLGSFTTFSTFGNETFNLIRDGQFISASSNVVLHLVLGLAAVWLGNVISRLI